MSQNDPKTTLLTTSITKTLHPQLNIFFSSAIYQACQTVWALEQLSSRYFVSDVVSEVVLEPFWLMLPGLGPNR